MSLHRTIEVLILSQLLITSTASIGSTDPWVSPGATHPGQLPVGAGSTNEDEAARRFVAHLETVMAKSIVPGIRRGVIARSTARPPALSVEITEDPSPYHMEVRIESDGALRVRLSLGYVTMHEAALDAVALSAALERPEQLTSYLSYQLALARENERRQAKGERRYRAVSFAQFAHIDGKTADAVFSEESFQRERSGVEANSLGWVVAYLLVQADPRLAGVSASRRAGDGRAAATLASASGWFPVPPVATALALAELAPAKNSDAARNRLCRAADLVEEGLQALKVDQPWSSRLNRDSLLQHQVASIEFEVMRMRRQGKCLVADAQHSI